MSTRSDRGRRTGSDEARDQDLQGNGTTRDVYGAAGPHVANPFEHNLPTVRPRQPNGGDAADGSRGRLHRQSRRRHRISARRGNGDGAQEGEPGERDSRSVTRSCSGAITAPW
jgi:hypothetical protein